MPAGFRSMKMTRIVFYTMVICVVVALATTPWFVDQAVAVRDTSAEADTPNHTTSVSLPAEAKAPKLLLQYCGTCHEAGRTSFDFDEASLNPAVMKQNRETWKLAVQKMRDKKMPPKKKKVHATHGGGAADHDPLARGDGAQGRPERRPARGSPASTRRIHECRT
ncbi:MAG: hypothetical protein EXR98_13955 [Gemmataceae bacterium]|nr:hypothetical protein [Gemmataceae bacterium]